MMMRFTLQALVAVALTGVAAAQSDNTETATKEYDSGAVYEGQFKDGKQHGQGTYTAPDGYEYSGEWVEGVIQGNGRAKFPNGSVYEGEFKEG
ncbi:MAG: 2-isopropylmalate synthase, partial [Pseudomonadota bacterium]